MRLAKHLYRHPLGAFYFVLSIPKPLQGSFRAKRLRYSLNTKDPREAKIQSYRHTAYWQGKFLEIKGALKVGNKEQERLKLAHAWLDNIPQQEEQKLTAIPDIRGNIPNSNMEQLLGNISKYDVQATECSDGSYLWACLKSDNDQDREEGQKLARELNLRGAKPKKVIEVEKPSIVKIIQSQKDDITPSRGNIRTMREVLIEYEKEVTSSSNGKKTVGKKTKLLHEFVVFIGPSNPVHKVNSGDLQKFKLHLINVRKYDPIKTVPDLFGYLKGFFNYCILHKYYLLGNPAEGIVKVSKRDKKMQAQARKKIPFDSLQLQKIFNPESFSTITTPHMFWGVLICHFQGLRASECGQLLVSDVTPTSIHVKVTRDNEQSLKTIYSNRDLPINPILIEIGLMDYIKDIGKFGSEYVFPYVEKEQINGKGSQLSDDFIDYLKKLNIKRPRQSLHAFRDNIADMFTDRGVNKEYISRFLGHEIPGITYEFYLEQYNLKKLIKECLPHMHSDINFSGIRYQKGQFDRYIEMRLKRNAATLIESK